MPPAGQDCAVFRPADILYVLEWAAATRCQVLLDDDRKTRQVAVVFPDLDQPAFLASGKAGQVLLASAAEDGQVRRYASLRQAVLAIRPLDDERHLDVDEAMEELRPRRPDRA